jgi:fructose/tagatose bisphosphate aldolase
VIVGVRVVVDVEVRVCVRVRVGVVVEVEIGVTVAVRLGVGVAEAKRPATASRAEQFATAIPASTNPAAAAILRGTLHRLCTEVTFRHLRLRAL